VAGVDAGEQAGQRRSGNSGACDLSSCAEVSTLAGLR
jgi:hypothetical protein